jgi:hypothetical protein
MGASSNILANSNKSQKCLERAEYIPSHENGHFFLTTGANCGGSSIFTTTSVEFYGR